MSYICFKCEYELKKIRSNEFFTFFECGCGTYYCLANDERGTWSWKNTTFWVSCTDEMDKINIQKVIFT